LYAATGDYILYIDADRQISLERFIPFGDVTSGWRVGRYDKPFRKVISFCLKMTNLFRYGYFIRDANCPFKIYKRTKIQPLLKELPVSYIIPIACLEVLARKHKLICSTIPTPHMPYKGVREGKLQSINRVSIKFFWDAFKEAISL
jgi:glycosyltransferase involved in cell wall biosynthesis